MSGAVLGGDSRRRPWLRWSASLALVLVLHGVAAFLLQRTRVVEDPALPEAAVLIDLAPTLLQAPPAQPAPTTPEPPPPDPIPPEPAPRVEAAPVIPVPEPPPVIPAKPGVVLPPPPRAAVRSLPRIVRPQIRASPAAPQMAAEQPAPATAAPAVAAPAASSAAAPQAATWASQLAAHLLRFRHYPPDAERRGFTGVAMMRFSVDASGRIVSVSLVRSSGHDVLDDEAQAWLQRAQPLPAPPPDRIAPAQIVVPLAFTLR